MFTSRGSLLWLNVLGGIAVLGSYAYGIGTNPLTRGEVWGGVPEALRPFYTVNMFLAAAGYFAFSYFVFFRIDPPRFGLFHLLYALILFPSALWLPLTFAMLEAPSPLLWWTIRATLALVGLGSLGMLAALVVSPALNAKGARRLALLGSAAFCLQTAVLDALVWPAFFTV